MSAQGGIRPGPRPVRDDGDAGAVRRRQLLLFSVIAALLLAGLAAWLGAGGGGARPPEGGIEAGIVAPDAAERVWTLRSEARLGGIETKLREMEREARSLRADNDRLAAKLEATPWQVQALQCLPKPRKGRVRPSSAASGTGAGPCPRSVSA